MKVQRAELEGLVESSIWINLVRRETVESGCSGVGSLESLGHVCVRQKRVKTIHKGGPMKSESQDVINIHVMLDVSVCCVPHPYTNPHLGVHGQFLRRSKWNFHT